MRILLYREFYLRSIVIGEQSEPVSNVVSIEFVPTCIYLGPLCMHVCTKLTLIFDLLACFSCANSRDCQP